jgi:chromosomal replication initiator protein
MVAMYLTRELTDMSLTAIGDFFGRDHTTVHHAYKTISEDYARDTELRSLIASIRNQLNA